MLHTTLARNTGGDGSGIYVTDSWGAPGTAALTNTIVVSHTVGITVKTGSTTTLEATLWSSGIWANGTDWGGDGTVITGTINLWGDPDFSDPDDGDYHIGPDSAARDAGVDAGVTTDIDGETRPAGAGYDIGANEYYGVTNSAPNTPSNPYPAKGATEVPLTATLNWQGGDVDGDVVTYTVAFGTGDPPPYAATTGQTQYTPALKANSTYYWSITASDGVEISAGPVWRFSTLEEYLIYLPLVLRGLP